MSVKHADVQLFLRQLALLIHGGMPLPDSLASMKNGSSRELRLLLSELERDCAGGESLSDAMSRHPAVFGNAIIGMVRSGEAAGTLAVALDDAAAGMRVNGQLIRMFRTALAYPFTVFFVILVMLFFFSWFLAPQFSAIYEDLFREEPLPQCTSSILALSQFCRTHIEVAVVLMLALAGGGLWLFSAGTRASGVSLKLLKLLPMTRRIFASLRLARICFSLAEQLKNRIPEAEALRNTALTVGGDLKKNIQDGADALERGEAFASVLRGISGFPGLIGATVEFGTQSDVPGRLSELGGIYLEESEVGLRGVEQIWSAIFLLSVSIICGVFLSSLLLPLIKIVESLTE